MLCQLYANDYTEQEVSGSTNEDRQHFSGTCYAVCVMKIDSRERKRERGRDRVPRVSREFRETLTLIARRKRRRTTAINRVSRTVNNFAGFN